MNVIHWLSTEKRWVRVNAGTLAARNQQVQDTSICGLKKWEMRQNKEWWLYSIGEGAERDKRLEKEVTCDACKLLMFAQRAERHHERVASCVRT